MKGKLLISSVLALFAAAGCSTHTPTQCTTAPQSEWMDADTFQSSLLDQGYQINEFKITEGNCYEIYGFDSSDNKVEIYFNPVDGSVVKQEMH